MASPAVVVGLVERFEEQREDLQGNWYERPQFQSDLHIWPPSRQNLRGRFNPSGGRIINGRVRSGTLSSVKPHLPPGEYDGEAG